MKGSYQRRSVRTSTTPLHSTSKEQLYFEVGYDDSVFHFPSTRHWSTISPYHPKNLGIQHNRTPEGQVIYEVKSATPILGARNIDIKISKIMPSWFENETTTKGKETQNLRDSFSHMATVEYRTVYTCRIRMGDLDVATNDYFRRKESHKFRKVDFFLTWSRNVSQPQPLHRTRRQGISGEMSCEARTPETSRYKYAS